MKCALTSLILGLSMTASVAADDLCDAGRGHTPVLAAKVTPERDEEKWLPVFRETHATTSYPERDDVCDQTSSRSG